jgi:crossover junction endonuclease MUS81
MTSLKVDNREQKIKDFFIEQKTPNISFENLEYGDFQIIHNDEIKFIFERKTIDDLLASIKDGRYHNQKARLFQVYKPSQIYYIIEGPVSFSSANKTQDKILQSSIINTCLRDKIGLFYTKNIPETIGLLQGIFSRFSDDPSKYCEEVNKEVETVVQTSSKDSPTQVFKAMLCQIPGISDKIAAFLVNKWPTLKDMHIELYSLEEEERVVLLSNLKVNDRKISKRVVENILKHLF